MLVFSFFSSNYIQFHSLLLLRIMYIFHWKNQTPDTENASTRSLKKHVKNMTCDFYAMGNDFPSGGSSIFVLLSFLYSCHQVAVRKHIRLPCNFPHFSMNRWKKKKKRLRILQINQSSKARCSYRDIQKI